MELDKNRNIFSGFSSLVYFDQTMIRLDQNKNSKGLSCFRAAALETNFHYMLECARYTLILLFQTHYCLDF